MGHGDGPVGLDQESVDEPAGVGEDASTPEHKGGPRLPVPTETALGDVAAPPVPDFDARLAAIEVALGAVTARLADEADRAAARERIIERQHEEVERLRSVARAGQLRPVVIDLCRLRNGLLRQAATVPAEMTGPKVAELLASFADEVEEALERCGVAVSTQEPGSAFAPGLQQVAAVVDTDDPARDGTVAGVVQDGYLEIDGGRVVVPARITVHRLTQKIKETIDG